jgi:hypothetical protein
MTVNHKDTKDTKSEYSDIRCSFFVLFVPSW